MNCSDLSTYEVGVEVVNNLKKLNYKGKFNFPKIIEYVKSEFGMIVNYKHENTGFKGIITHKGDLLPIEILTIEGDPFKSIKESLDKSLEIVTKLQLLKRK
jgi:hypothetical protein